MREVEALCNTLQHGNFLHVLSHVGRQDERNNSLPEVHKLCADKVLQKVTFLFAQDVEYLHGVVVFLNWRIIAVDGALSDCIGVVAVCVPVVTEIMTSRCY